MAPPCLQAPDTAHLHTHMTLSLSRVQEAMDQSLQSAFKLVEGAPHRRLWQLLASEAMKRGAYADAMKALVRVKDFKRLQFLQQVLPPTGCPGVTRRLAHAVARQQPVRASAGT